MTSLVLGMGSSSAVQLRLSSSRSDFLLPQPHNASSCKPHGTRCRHPSITRTLSLLDTTHGGVITSPSGRRVTTSEPVSSRETLRKESGPCRDSHLQPDPREPKGSCPPPKVTDGSSSSNEAYQGRDFCTFGVENLEGYNSLFEDRLSFCVTPDDIKTVFGAPSGLSLGSSTDAVLSHVFQGQFPLYNMHHFHSRTRTPQLSDRLAPATNL